MKNTLADLLRLRLSLVFFPFSLGTSGQGMVPPVMGWILLHQLTIKAFLQAGLIWEILQMRFLSQVTLGCVRLIIKVN